jgi:hypothetical protein
MVILGRKILLISFKAKANSLTPNYLLLVIPRPLQAKHYCLELVGFSRYTP